MIYITGALTTRTLKQLIEYFIVYIKGGDLFMKAVYTLALVLLVVGGLNWGLVGLLNFDLVAAIFGEMSMLSRVVYSLVGISSVYVAIVAATGQK